MDKDFIDVTEFGNKGIVFVLILIIAAISAFGYFFVYKKYNFSPKKVNIEFGSTISTDVNDYLKKKVVDTSGYKLDISGVKDEIGTYSYSITYNKITKKGEINIVDTTPPVFETKDLTVEVGDEDFFLGDALISCEDASKPCLVNYKNEQDGEKIYKVGEYTIPVVVSDLYNNKKDATIKLNVVEKGSIVKEEEKDLDFYKSSEDLPNFNGEYYEKFDRAINSESDKLEELSVEIGNGVVDSFVQSNYPNYKVKETTIVEMYNKSGYVIGVVVKVVINNGTDKTIYVTK